MRSRSKKNQRVFGVVEFSAWLDRLARSRFGISGEEFIGRYLAGEFVDVPLARDMAAVIPLIRRDSDEEETGEAAAL